MMDASESEVVEFKEARSNYSFNDIGKYFSALSNEANLRGLQEAWLVFGITLLVCSKYTPSAAGAHHAITFLPTVPKSCLLSAISKATAIMIVVGAL